MDYLQPHYYILKWVGNSTALIGTFVIHRINSIIKTALILLTKLFFALKNFNSKSFNKQVALMGQALCELLRVPEKCRDALRVTLHLVEKSLQRIHRGQKNAMYTTQKSIENKVFYYQFGEFQVLTILFIILGGQYKWLERITHVRGI